MRCVVVPRLRKDFVFVFPIFLVRDIINALD